MSYYSEIDLGGLGQSPKTTDPNNFGDFTDVYNAIHILAQWVDVLYENLRNLAESMNNENDELRRFLTTKAAVPLSKGMFVSLPVPFMCPVRGPNARWYNGAVPGYFNGDKSAPLSVGISPTFPFPDGAMNITPPPATIFGICMDDADAGEEITIALGPGHLELEGAEIGDQVWVRQTEVDISGTISDDGGVYVVPFDTRNVNTRNLIRIGFIDTPGRLLIPGSRAELLWTPPAKQGGGFFDQGGDA